MKKINIGLDIGVASVGYSLVDEDCNVVDLGVRLFDDVANSKDGKLLNEKRRSARCSRRRLWRQRVRKNAYINLLVEHKLIQDPTEFYEIVEDTDIQNEYGVDNFVQLKVKGLTEKLDQKALILVLFHYLKHRGFFYLTEEMLKEMNIDIENENYVKKYPSEELNEFYKTNGFYVGSEISGKFAAAEWKEEIIKLLSNQDVSDEFQQKYLEIFMRVRNFADGPGGPKAPTKYGRYRLENGKVVEKCKNLWDLTIGKCTYYPELNRGLKNSPKAEMFNLMNDLSNIYFFNNSNHKIDAELKKMLFDEAAKSLNKAKPTSAKINNKLIISCWNKLYDDNPIDELQICGNRTGVDKEKLITELKNYSTIVKWLVTNKIWDKKVDLLDKELLNLANDVYVMLSSVQDVLKRKELLSSHYPTASVESNIKLIKDIYKINDTHSLSYKAMDEYIDFFIDHLDENENQMRFFYDKFGKNVENVFEDKMRNKNQIPAGLFNDAIISPTTRRAFNETIKVLNKIIERYSKKYQIDNITIELAREKNTADARKTIEKSNNNNRKTLENILKENDSVISADKLSGAQRIRLKLWHQQQKHDLYDGQLISFKEALTGYGLDIDHIIPFKLSGDDSLSNKVLTKSHLNREKSERTPYQWLSSKGEYENFVNNVYKFLENSKEIKVKKANLFYKNDPRTELAGFIAKNLVDTRYASKLVKDIITDFFDINRDKFGHIKVKVIRGSVTSFARYSLFMDPVTKKTLLPKNREIYLHHAIDASIISCLGTTRFIQNKIDYLNKKLLNDDNMCKHEGYLVNVETGEQIDVTGNFSEILNDKLRNFINQVVELNEFGNPKVKFSRKITNKLSTQLSDETIYSFKWADDTKTRGNIIKKLSILDSNVKLDELRKLFDDEKINADKSNSLNKLLCYKEKHPIYEKLKIIFNQYLAPNVKNPFIEYANQNGFKHLKFIEIDGIRVKQLKLIGDEKEIDNIIVLKNHNDNAIMKNLNWTEVRIYKNNKGNLVGVPMNQRVFTYRNSKMCIDENKLNALLNKLNIDSKEYIKITRGTCFINKETNNIFYCCGFCNIGFELKSLTCDNKILNKDRIYASPKKISEDYFLIDIDVLGKIYNKREIKL